MPARPDPGDDDMTSPEPASPVTTTDLWIAHPGGRIFARRWTPQARPEGAPFVLFHDSLGCVELWREFPAALSRATGHPVFAYDRLGFGRSDPRHERPALGFVAEEAAVYFPVVRRALAIDAFVGVGHSVGGGMAIHCAAELEGCRALVTIAAQVFAEDRTLDGIRAARERFSDPAQLGRLARYHGDKARWVVDAWTENWLDPRFAAWNLDAVLPAVRCPILAIHGERDEYGSTRQARRIEQLGGGASRIVLLAEGGHLPHREQPDRVARTIARFVDDLAASKPDGG